MDERAKIGKRISFVTMIQNVILSAVKLAIGLLTNSVAIISDSVHSISDVLTTIMVIVGFSLSGAKADEEHPYGHEKFEPVMGMLLAIVLALVALYLGWCGIDRIQNPETVEIGILAIGVTVASIIVKEYMYWYTIAAARKIDSSALKADAWHHRSDAISSVGALVGLVGAKLFGVWYLEPLAAVVICLIILKVAIDIFKGSLEQIIDRSASPEVLERIKGIVLASSGVEKIDDLKTRLHSNLLYVDLEIAVARNLSLITAHEIAEKVHDTLEASELKIKHCTVHVNPAE